MITDEDQIFPPMKTLNAKEIGLTLKISDETLRKIDKIVEESISQKAIQEMRNFVFR